MDGIPPALETIARLIQLSLTPVFLLSALASLLGVFAVRLSHAADQVEEIERKLDEASEEGRDRLKLELDYHRRRTLALDVAVVLAATGGALTGGSVLALFIGAIAKAPLAVPLYILFGAAIVAAIGALAAFVFEMLLASRGLRSRSREAGTR
ncbi:MAG: DUF2721 domain-containing protein [Methylobacteriaceae bacterium]|nr:DUF2721 domain-containing protein [Methylobacteriaceae bacterium]